MAPILSCSGVVKFAMKFRSTDLASRSSPPEARQEFETRLLIIHEGRDVLAATHAGHVHSSSQVGEEAFRLFNDAVLRRLRHSMKVSFRLRAPYTGPPRTGQRDACRLRSSPPDQIARMW